MPGVGLNWPAPALNQVAGWFYKVLTPQTTQTHLGIQELYQDLGYHDCAQGRFLGLPLGQSVKRR